MTDDIIVTNAEIFTEYALGNIEKWQKLIGYKIEHDILGKADLVKIEDAGDDIYLCCQFSKNAIKKFLASDFTNHFTLDILPPDISEYEKTRQNIIKRRTKILAREMEAKKRKLALEEAKRKKEEAEQKRKEEEEKQKKAERESRLEFETLKKKYRIVSDNNQPTSPLFAILKRVDCHEKLSKKEIEWLINHHHYIFSIQYLTERYERAKDPWDLISAASIYRKIKKPEKALELTNDCIPNDKKSKAAVCTTRGAAYKDLEDLEKARVLAEKAIEYQPDSFYPYNLLGGIYYKLGKPEEGDQYFVKAIELGSTSKAQENEIRNLLETESQEFIQRTVTYLLSKDPKKYRWATYYLKR